jgi:hypothetical protein
MALIQVSQIKRKFRCAGCGACMALQARGLHS